MVHKMRLILIGVVFAGVSAVSFAEAAMDKSVESLFLERASLSGKQVRLSGKVVKVNNGIMKRNFIHLQDGSGSNGTNDITITSQETANVGDEVVVIGVVSTDVDFGAGYSYPLLLEKATFAPAAGK